MELVLAAAIGLLVGCGVWLVLKPTTFSVVLGLTLLSYAVNLLILAGGRLDRLTPPLTLKGASALADPLPQALVLTAIVISFGMSAFLVALALRGHRDSGSDCIDLSRDGREPAE
jgi:multicomponent K+:H+ antiporter subunit C